MSQLTSKPSAVAIEPLSGSKAAVLTLLIQLPFGDGEFAPSGQSGMAVGSALIAIGKFISKSSLVKVIIMDALNVLTLLTLRLCDIDIATLICQKLKKNQNNSLRYCKKTRQNYNSCSKSAKLVEEM